MIAAYDEVGARCAHTGECLMRVTKVLAAAATAGLLSWVGTAQATPYAFANNLITNLSITFANGSSLLPLQGGSTNVYDNALFGGSPLSGSQKTGLPNAGLDVAQAFSGPGPAPAENTFTPVAPGTFVGTRGDASIGAGGAGVATVSNVAEGYGAAAGNSTGKNSSTITFQVAGTGQPVSLSFTDTVKLIASTAGLINETATPGVTNTFSITPANSNVLATFQPSAINTSISSQNGNQSPNTYDFSGPFMFTTPVLTSGVIYNISLLSLSTENITPGIPVPEPATLGLLGAGLLGLGMLGRRKN